MHIINAVYGDSTGGRWVATLKTAELLARAGHRITLLIDPCDAHKVPNPLPEGVSLLTLKNSGHYDLVASIKARSIIRQQAVDAIICHSGRAVWMLKRAAPKTVPVIAFNHSHNIKRTLKADAFFCITPYMQQLVQQSRAAGKPCYVISNAIAIPDATRLQTPQNQPLRIGTIGRLAHGKGTLFLVEALALIKARGIAFHALIAGDGEEMPELLEAQQRLGLSQELEFLGWVGAEAKDDFFNQIDVFCYTSYRDVQPLAVMEMMAYGKAVIANDLEGPSTLYHHGKTAWVVPKCNAVALADGLMKLLSDAELRSSLGAQARQYALTHFSEAVITEQLQAALVALVAKHQKPSA